MSKNLKSIQFQSRTRESTSLLASWGDNSAREPENEEWRLGVLESMIQIKQDNWSVIFSDEEEEDLLEENDIDMMIYEVCTS